MGNISNKEISKLKNFCKGKKQGSIHERYGYNETQNGDDALH